MIRKAMTNRNVNVPQLVKNIRTTKELTQVKLARKLGVTFATVNSWENGKRLPQPFLLKQLIAIEKKLNRKKSVKKK